MESTKVIEHLTRAKTGRPHEELNLFVKVFNPGSVGGTPCVAVTALLNGFDWDHGRILLDTERPLTTLSPEDVIAIKESVKKGQSWHAYQQYKKQADEIKGLKAEIARLTGTGAATVQSTAQ